VYLYGLMSLTVFMASLRAVAEHQHYADDSSTQCGYAALRNFSCNPVSRYLMGAYGFGEHYTHHRVPSIPYYWLKIATQTLARDDASFLPRHGYFSVLATIVTGRRHQ
jgi:fatty acid desaturase